VKDYYQTLGVPRTATADDIKRAYRRLASQHHPDKGGDKARFQEIQEAYGVLGDAQQRQQYDHPRPQNMHMPFGAQGFDLDQIFSMFGHNVNPHHRTPRMTLWITLRDAMEGGPKAVAVQINNVVTNLQIDLPSGLNDGDTIRYPGLAPGGHDLVITYKIREEPGWQRHGRDLHCEVSVDVLDLILGADITVVDVRGRHLSLVVPPQTQPGTNLRMRGQGMPPSGLPGQATIAGDIIVRMAARLPRDLSPEFQEACRQQRGR
jgi:curved DNA-binding protein